MGQISAIQYQSLTLLAQNRAVLIQNAAIDPHPGIFRLLTDPGLLDRVQREVAKSLEQCGGRGLQRSRGAEAAFKRDGPVDDAVEALSALMEAPAVEGQVVNVGSDEEIRIRDLAGLVVEEAGRGRIEYVPWREVYGEDFVDPSRRVPDLTRLREVIAFRPRRSVRDAVRDLLSVGVSA